MPTYEYACKACDHRFEIVQSFSEDALSTCPDCQQDALRKVYNAAGIIFKGDGWHIKDYGSSGTVAAPAATTSDDTSSSSSDEGSSAPATGSRKRKKGGTGDASGSAVNRPAAG